MDHSRTCHKIYLWSKNKKLKSLLRNNWWFGVIILTMLYKSEQSFQSKWYKKSKKNHFRQLKLWMIWRSYVQAVKKVLKVLLMKWLKKFKHYRLKTVILSHSKHRFTMTFSTNLNKLFLRLLMVKLFHKRPSLQLDILSHIIQSLKIKIDNSPSKLLFLLKII